MEKEFVTYDQALALKELGFDEDCLMYIDDEEDLINDDTAEWIGAVKAPNEMTYIRRPYFIQIPTRNIKIIKQIN